LTRPSDYDLTDTPPFPPWSGEYKGSIATQSRPLPFHPFIPPTSRGLFFFFAPSEPTPGSPGSFIAVSPRILFSSPPSFPFLPRFFCHRLTGAKLPVDSSFFSSYSLFLFFGAGVRRHAFQSFISSESPGPLPFLAPLATELNEPCPSLSPHSKRAYRPPLFCYLTPFSQIRFRSIEFPSTRDSSSLPPSRATFSPLSPG